MLQKNAFGQRFFSNFMHGFKSAILVKMKNCQNGTFEPVHEIKKFLAKSILLEHYESGNNFFFVLGSNESLEGLEH